LYSPDALKKAVKQKCAHLVAEDKRILKDGERGKMHCILFGNPAILSRKDPLALRRRITPVLPFLRHLFVVFSPSTIDGLGVFQRRQ